MSVLSVIPQVNTKRKKNTKTVKNKKIKVAEIKDSKNSSRIWKWKGKQLVQVSCPEVTFDDVVGHDYAKQECLNIVEGIKYPELFKKNGVNLLNGVMLVSKPGNGKTLLIKALAHESNCNFFLLSAADVFGVRYFSNKQAEMIQKTFEAARKNAPSIIFIDEFHLLFDGTACLVPELLTQMDGFSSSKYDQVIVIGAANTLGKINKALIRPGRIDTIIHLQMLDEEERLKLLLLRCKNKKIHKDVDFKYITEITTSFTGAEIEGICEGAARLSLQNKEKKIRMIHFEEFIDTIYCGPKINKKINFRQKQITAYHEAGHLLLNLLLPHTSQVIKVTIIPHQKTQGVVFARASENSSKSKIQYENEICVCFGGTVGEFIGLDIQTQGCDHDLQTAKIYLKEMIDNGFVRGALAHYEKVKYMHRYDFNDAQIQVCENFLQSQHQRALELIRTHKPVLKIIAEALLEKNTLKRNEIYELVGKHIDINKEKI